MKKLLVTGASGFLGWHLCRLAQAIGQVYGIYHHQAIAAKYPQGVASSHPQEAALPQILSIPLDLTDLTALKTQFQILKPDAVIHTAAISSPNACQENPIPSSAVNVHASWHLAELSAAAQIPYLFTSSEQVFNGLNPPYRETDRVCPINHYGEQKVAAEVGILERHPAATICRMPLMYGVAPRPSFIQPFIEALKSGQPLNLFTDEIRNPVSGTAAAQGILMALEKQVTGYLHLGGKEQLSRYEMGLLLADILQIESPKLNACRQADVKMSAPRPPNASLDSSVAYSLGYAPRSMREELRELLN
ncbi:MAG: NAD(P)-dependent oxidoreductase [Timaviella obliquedivisa GSE-PSE-MK23-08B]|jgi:dTDP-4-dehydrorhamnose reductase|nr:NAD(P)-dependent oxidoreductase [Timaviella obliquedivisa GSE-PSE-MK23-08B]